MFKALLKMQMLEVFSWLFMDKKTGKNRAKKGVVTFGIIYLFVFLFLSVIFFIVAKMMCAPLVNAGYTWMYFAIMGLISVALGVFGSVFNTFSSLYQARDNDLLLSMPISPSKILAVKLAGVFAMGLLYELIVMIPTVIAYFVFAKVNILGIIFSILIPFILSLFVLTLSCILGWVVALVNGRIKNKNLITVILSLAFIVGYYFCYSKAYAAIQNLIANPDSVGKGMKNFLYPLYHMGLAAQGNAASMLIFSAFCIALFALFYLVLSKSFLRLATASTSVAKAKGGKTSFSSRSIANALLYKELKRFLGSSVYMLNCGLGTVIMLVGGIAVIIKKDYFSSMLSEMFLGYESLIPLLAVAVICMMITMNDITAPSISLEGKNLWLAQSLPVSSHQVLYAKLRLHILLTAVPALILSLCIETVIKPNALFCVMIPVIACLFTAFAGFAGLLINLKMPNLNWTNETVPVKQSMPVVICLFGGWVVVLAFGAIYYALMKFINPEIYIIAVAAVLSALCFAMAKWINKKGVQIFENL